MNGGLLVVEGVTGAGKTRLISAIQNLATATGGPSVSVIDEDVTLGVVLEDLNDPAWRARPGFAGLEAGLEAARQARDAEPGGLVILERFHLTPYALLRRWAPLVPFDQALAALGARQLLLDYRDRLIEARSIRRADRADWAVGMDGHYGSRAQAIEAVRRSQAQRRRGLHLSRLPFLHLDTGEEAWDAYARTVLMFATA